MITHILKLNAYILKLNALTEPSSRIIAKFRALLSLPDEADESSLSPALGMALAHGWAFVAKAAANWNAAAPADGKIAEPGEEDWGGPLTLSALLEGVSVYRGEWSELRITAEIEIFEEECLMTREKIPLHRLRFASHPPREIDAAIHSAKKVVRVECPENGSLDDVWVVEKDEGEEYWLFLIAAWLDSDDVKNDGQICSKRLEGKFCFEQIWPPRSVDWEGTATDAALYR